MKTARQIDPRSILIQDLPVVETRLEIGGVPTAVLQGGKGPPVILLHGPGESSVWWMRVVPDLVATHRVVVPDLPGHGASGAGGDDVYTVDGMLGWLDELIDRTSDSPPVLVGHVLGGGIGVRFAFESGDRLRRLVLVDSVGLAPFRPSLRFAFRLLTFSLRPDEKTYGKFLPHCMYDVGELRAALGERWDPFIAYNIQCARSSDTQAAVRTLMRRFAFDPLSPEELDGIEVPTALIWGRHDRALPLGIAEEASTRYRWPLHVVEDARDDPKLERPEAFLDAFRATVS